MGVGLVARAAAQGGDADRQAREGGEEGGLTGEPEPPEHRQAARGLVVVLPPGRMDHGEVIPAASPPDTCR